MEVYFGIQQFKFYFYFFTCIHYYIYFFTR